MSKEIEFDKRSECSAYVTVNGKTIYIEDSPTTGGLYIRTWESNEGIVGDAVSLYPAGAGIYTERI